MYEKLYEKSDDSKKVIYTITKEKITNNKDEIIQKGFDNVKYLEFILKTFKLLSDDVITIFKLIKDENTIVEIYQNKEGYELNYDRIDKDGKKSSTFIWQTYEKPSFWDRLKSVFSN